MFHELNPWGRVIDGKLLVPKPVPHFMEPKGSWPCSQQPATCLCPIVTYRNNSWWWGFLSTSHDKQAGEPPTFGCS